MKEPKCEDCGMLYKHMGLDLVLADQSWKRITEDVSIILCANCICKRAEKKGYVSLLAWIR